MNARAHGLGASCLLAVALGATCWHDSGVTSAQLVESESTQLIVMISGQLREKTIGAGIIFAREKDQLYIATANHVVREGSLEAKDLQIRLRTFPDKPFKARLLKHVDQESDMAVLSVEGLDTYGIDICELKVDRLTEAKALKRGDLVYPVGNPNGIPWGMPVSPDRVAQLVGDNLTFQSTFISLGHSGGALLDEHGELVGMIRKDAPPFGLATNINKVLQVLRGWGYPVELRPANTRPPLFAAVESRDANEVKRLLDVRCAEVNGRYKGFTPLHRATENGSEPIVEFLLWAGALPNVVTQKVAPRYYEATPLQLAAQNGQPHIVKLLLDAGAYIEGYGPDRRTPLALAIWGGHEEVAKLLIRAGAKTEFVKGNDTMLYEAARDGEVEVAKLLIEIGANIDQNSALIAAINNHKIEIVKLLLATGADVNRKGNLGEAPLLCEAIVTAWQAKSSGEKASSVEIVKLLLKARANTEEKFDDKTPLTLAASYGQVEVVKLLLEAGANVNGTDAKGRTALHYAAEMDRDPTSQTEQQERRTAQLELLQLLLQRGANVNAVDNNGEPPLCGALIGYGDFKDFRINVAEILLKAGARTSFDWWRTECRGGGAARQGNKDIDDLLQSYADKH